MLKQNSGRENKLLSSCEAENKYHIKTEMFGKFKQSREKITAGKMF